MLLVKLHWYQHLESSMLKCFSKNASCFLFLFSGVHSSTTCLDLTTSAREGSLTDWRVSHIFHWAQHEGGGFFLLEEFSGLFIYLFFFPYLLPYHPASVWSNFCSWTEETVSKSRLFTYFYRNACRCCFHRSVAILPEGTVMLNQLWTLKEVHNQYFCGTIPASLNSKSFKYSVSWESVGVSSIPMCMKVGTLHCQTHFKCFKGISLNFYWETLYLLVLWVCNSVLLFPSFCIHFLELI